MTLNILENFELKRFNTFGVSVKALQCVRVTKPEELQEVRSYLHANPDMKYLILGGGSDILFTQDFDGLVILMELKGMQKEGEDGDFHFVRAAAGETWHTFVRRTMDARYYGLENLALIPGTVGAAPIQNIGAYGLEVGDQIESVRCFDLESGKEVDLSAPQCKFGYRTSFFKSEDAKKYIITSVLFRFPKNWTPNITYKELFREINNNQPPVVRAEDIYSSVVALRRRKLPDPCKIGNAGSFFKNPILKKEDFLPLLKNFPDMVFYPAAEDKVKVSAAWLIDAAGLKGIRMGDCGTYEKQPLVIVNYGEASGEEIYAMAQDIHIHVKNHFGIRLYPEVVIV